MYWNLENYKQIEMQKLLSSLECRLSIAKVNGKPVHSGYAIVRIVRLDTHEISFTSDLVLPTDQMMTVCFELVTETQSIRLEGRVMSRENHSAPYRYGVKYDIPDARRLLLVSMINRLASESESYAAKAVESYASCHILPELQPRINCLT